MVNAEPVLTLGSWTGLVTNREVDPEVVYQLTKAIFDHLDTFHQTAEWMKIIRPDTALTELNIPLHPGALRYYREIGLEIPDALVPPEATTQ